MTPPPSVCYTEHSKKRPEISPRPLCGGTRRLRLCFRVSIERSPSCLWPAAGRFSGARTCPGSTSRPPRAPRLWLVSPSLASLRKPGGSAAATAAAGPPLAPCRTKRYNSAASESSFPSRLTDPEMQSMVVETVPHLRTSASTSATEPRLSLPTDVERFTDDDELPGDNVLPGF